MTISEFSIEKKTCGELWVSDGLGSDYQYWNHSQPIFISAQTGKGKNHFIMNQLIPFAYKRGSPIILISNRAALNLQQKQALLKSFHLPNIYTDAELSMRDQFGPVTIWNYQSLARILKNTSIDPYFSYYSKQGYLIMDECHYFLADAPFNARTELALQQLTTLFPGYVHIYMTATPEGIFEVVCQYEQMFNTKRKYTLLAEEWPDGIETLHKKRQKDVKDIIYYSFPRSYDGYNLYFFDNDDFIVGEIKKTKGEKWLWFRNDKTSAAQLQQKIPSSHILNSTKKTSDNPVWRKILMGMIHDRVLISTSVLDNGTSLTDPDLKHLVIDFSSPTAMLQMLGRKRKNPGETVNLYFYIPTKEQIRNRLQSIQRRLDFIISFRQNPWFFLKNNWDDLDSDIRALFYFDDNNQLILNNLADYELRIQQQFYSDILFDMQESSEPRDIIPDAICKLLEKEYTRNLWIDFAQQEALKNDLVSLISQKLPCNERSQFEDLYKRFMEIAKQITFPSVDIRPAIGAEMATMNKYLEQLGINWEMKKYKKQWTANPSRRKISCKWDSCRQE